MKRQHGFEEIQNNYETLLRSEIAVCCTVSLYEGMCGMGGYGGFDRYSLGRRP